MVYVPSLLQVTTDVRSTLSTIHRVLLSPISYSDSFVLSP